jgi:ribonuclease P protein component
MIARAKTDVATKETTSHEAAWLCGPDELPWREKPACAASSEGPAPADCMSSDAHQNGSAVQASWSDRRLRLQRDFQALREQGVSRAHPLLVFRTAPNKLGYSRFGFAISRRIARRAVVRNRLRRRLQDLMRRAPVQGGWDMLLIARTSAPTATFDELQQALANVMERAKVLAPVGGSEGSDR